jgi:hypothetical protein
MGFEERGMHWRIGAGVLLVACACGPVEREAIVDPHTAVALGPRVHVVGINGKAIDEQTIGQAEGGVALYGANGKRGATLAPSDRLDVRITYEDGDTVPHEGVVRMERKKALAEIGATVVVVGSVMGLVGGVGAAAATDYPSTNCLVLGPCTHSNADLRGVFAGVGVGGAVIGSLGLTMLVIGMVKLAHIDASRTASVPGAFSVSF